MAEMIATVSRRLFRKFRRKNNSSQFKVSSINMPINYTVQTVHSVSVEVVADNRHPEIRKSPLQLNTYARRFCWGQNDHAAFTLQYTQKTAQVSLNEVLMIFKHKSPPKA